MSRFKIVVEGVGGLGYALFQFGIAVVLTTVDTVADTAREIHRELELERETELVARIHRATLLAREYGALERDREAEAALDRLVERYQPPKLCVQCKEPMDPVTASMATCHAMCPHVKRRFAHRPSCEWWCGREYTQDVPLLFQAPASMTHREGREYGWFSRVDMKPIIVWCSAECKAENRIANPTARAATPAS